MSLPRRAFLRPHHSGSGCQRTAFPRGFGSGAFL